MRRFSFRREAISESFLRERLRGALSYNRIAGYFRSSLSAVAGEEIESVSGKVRVVCIRTERAGRADRSQSRTGDTQGVVRGRSHRMGRRVARASTAALSASHERQARSAVLPREGFGLLHGKAGVITQAGGEKTSFLGSANATAPGWANNYELLWEDERPESVAWVQEEFEAL